MTIDQLIALLIGFLRARHGSFYTSTNLRHNPDVCHACCIWFLTNIARLGVIETLTTLDSMSKSTFKQSQSHALAGPSMPKKMLAQVRGSSHAHSGTDVAAIQYALAYHQQPASYIGDVTTVVANIVISMMTSGQDGMMIYMLGGGGAGHVICLRRNVGGILIYDPNMGIMSARLADTDTWSEVLRRILNWYRTEMDLTRFGYLFR